MKCAAATAWCKAAKLPCYKKKNLGVLSGGMFNTLRTLHGIRVKTGDFVEDEKVYVRLQGNQFIGGEVDFVFEESIVVRYPCGQCDQFDKEDGIYGR